MSPYAIAIIGLDLLCLITIYAIAAPMDRQK